MVETMFSGISTDGPFGGGHSEQMYRSMMNEEYANAIVKRPAYARARDRERNEFPDS